MQPQIIPQAPQPHCYICYSKEIDKVCHHCGKAICQKHKNTLIFRNPEFIRLSLDSVHFKIKDIAHCRDCAKKIHRKRLLWRCLGWFFPFNWIHSRYLAENYPPLPTIPTVSTIFIKEEIKGRITLDETGKYNEIITISPKGNLDIAVQFNDIDRERTKMYSRRYNPRPEEITFHAGFIVAPDTSNVQFESSVIKSHLPVNTFELLGKVAKQSFLSGESEEKSADHWSWNFPYNIVRSDKKKIPLPIQLVPILVRDDALALEIHSHPEISSLIQVESARIDQLTVCAPEYCSKVTFVDPSATIGGLTVTWKKLDISDTINQSVDESAKENTNCDWHSFRSHYIRFKNNIRLYEQKAPVDAKLSGHLTVTLNGSLSGFRTIMLFYPWGKKHNHEEIQSKIKLETTVEVDFEIDLSKLRCINLYPQYVDRDPNPKVYSNVILDHHIITKLTQRLSEIDAYVKRVTENPTRTDKVNAYVTNHFWDISGRHYKDLYPVDFHLVLTGRSNQEQRGISTVTAHINVHGFVTDNEMKQIVDESRERLQDVVDEIFSTQSNFTRQEKQGKMNDTENDLNKKRATELASQISKLVAHLKDMLNDA